jgi:phage terminase large subunit GpA-like protein
MLPPAIECLPPARGIVAAALARGLKPKRRRSVSQWADEERYVARESGSPLPGKWSNDYVPEMVEVMDCLNPRHPAREVSLKKSAQVGASEAGLNMLGFVITDLPSPIMVVLPTTDEMKKYVRLKLQPAIDVTPALKKAVKTIKSRDEESSTTTFKRFAGGFLQLAGANASSGLQMTTVRILVLEEVSEYPMDVDGRGDPVDLAIERTQGWEGREKIAYISTSGIKGQCRVTRKYEASDMRVRYMPCPHCGAFQPFYWDRLDKEAVAPTYICIASGCVIEESSKPWMRARGIWVKTFPGEGAPGKFILPEDLGNLGDRIKPDVLMDGRQPGFAINGLYSATKSWGRIVKQWREAQGSDEKLKVFTQQVLGEPWEAQGEAPDHERLFERRAKYEWRKIPRGALFLTGAADVQGDRIEWAIYAWGVGLTSWLIDKGIIEGDPNNLTPWSELNSVLEKSYIDAYGKPWRMEAFGVDTGYLSQACYRWVRMHAATGRVFALDGRDGWKLPPLGTPSTKDVDYQGKKQGQVRLWPVGTFGLKSELYSSIGKLVRGADKDTGLYPPGTAFYGDACDQAYLQQLTAEQVIERKSRSGAVELVWAKKQDRNEAHDIAVYNRALAHHLSDGMRPDEWAALAARRGAAPEDVQRDLAKLWIPPAVEEQAAPPASEPPLHTNETDQPDIWNGANRNLWD